MIPFPDPSLIRGTSEDSVTLYDFEENELFQAGAGITLLPVARHRFLAVEIKDGKPGRSFLYAVKEPDQGSVT